MIFGKSLVVIAIRNNFKVNSKLTANSLTFTNFHLLPVFL